MMSNNISDTKEITIGWRAEKNKGLYWYLGSGGTVNNDVECGQYIDDWRHSTGNYFKTKKEAKYYKEFLEAEAVIRKDAGGYKFRVHHKNFYGLLSVDSLEGEDPTIYVTYDKSYNYYEPHAIYFDDPSSISASMAEHPKEWEIYARYKFDKKLNN